MKRSESRVVVADTSFLMIPGLFRVDIGKELDRLLECRYELSVPSPVMRELEQISQWGKTREKVAARVGLMLAKRGSVVNAEDGADESILKLATEKKCLVGTTDAALRKELRRQGVPVIYLRQKSHLAVDGQIW